MYGLVLSQWSFHRWSQKLRKDSAQCPRRLNFAATTDGLSSTPHQCSRCCCIELWQTAWRMTDNFCMPNNIRFKSNHSWTLSWCCMLCLQSSPGTCASHQTQPTKGTAAQSKHPSDPKGGLLQWKQAGIKCVQHRHYLEALGKKWSQSCLKHFNFTINHANIIMHSAWIPTWWLRVPLARC